MNKYRDKFRQDRCRYTADTNMERHQRLRTNTPSPPDVYRFNGEVMKTKTEGWESPLQELFQEQLCDPLGPDFPSMDLSLPPHCPQLQDTKPLLAPPPAHQVASQAQASLLWELPHPSRLATYPALFQGRGTGFKAPSLGRSLSPGSLMDTDPGGSFDDETVRLGKDEKIAREAGIGFDVKDIVNLPMDEFNDLLSKHELSEEQLNLCRDIRRRGKNKVAAQNCRKRKIDQIDELQDRLNEANRVKNRLKSDHERLTEEYEEEARRLEKLSDQVLRHHNKSPSHYRVQVFGDDQVRILPKVSPSERDQEEGRGRSRAPHEYPGPRASHAQQFARATLGPTHYMAPYN